MAIRKYQRCYKDLPLEDFKLKSDGERTLSCIPCAAQDALRKKNARAARRKATRATDSNKENQAPSKQDDTLPDTNVNSRDSSGSPASPPVIETDPGRALPWAEFCALLKQHRLKTCDITTYVALDDVEDEDGEEMANRDLAAHIVDAICTNMAY
ncbi:hypothetical protein AURDEDRAFT_177476 [Auricularia subglabra TFB-10046 SS5]|uniref:Uncharacterized protein n=1 Tax=Auricularia subglabra (strain TFB-10046 / SS5) TaxID=717982 RepID=J0WM98_AURST|nr:hypothetical protein AURDEDRAFT_177476 [Auricularia subglabra TFB-10046 SS5]